VPFARRSSGNRVDMGFDDKAENQGTDIKGRAKEAAGSLTGDDELKAEGRGDQAEASVKKAGENVKDAVDDVKDAVKK
jgi:uncharacterized protein YjbJ (UPF0337 family)